jgi:hypothetical protein
VAEGGGEHLLAGLVDRVVVIGDFEQLYAAAGLDQAARWRNAVEGVGVFAGAVEVGVHAARR